ncbi:hypothetical protein LSTR_LSTR001272 [Laodelphax striatellus]|uniref:DNA-dependent protein kinase catalytic subunit n=1 Tax=Laodelphax striatellus TaxID=195883 RepID=A0A482XB95_LAOST|nr:hypothetical protein LSTR_LSTR001272 [Laodelphax striatellus]
MENELESIHDLLSTTDDFPVGNLKTLLGKIKENLMASDKHGLDKNIAILFGHDDEGVEGKNVVAFIKSCLSSRSHHVVEFLKFMENLCVLYPEALINYVEKIIDISKLCVLSKSVTTNTSVTEHGNNLVRTAVETFHGSGYDFSGIYDSFKCQIELGCIKGPKVCLAFFKLVGVLCKFYPDSMQQEKCKLFKEAAYMLAKQGRKNEDERAYLVIEGSFVAINGLLFLFTTDELKKLEELNTIYDSMKLVISVDSRQRHTPHRAAFSIIENHSEKISDLLKRDYVDWHEKLIKWIDHNNKDDKGISMRAYNAFINHMAKLLSIEVLEEQEEEAIAERKQMVQFFKALVSSNLVEKLSGENASNVAAAVESIGLFAPILDHSEIEKLFEDLVQKIDLSLSDVDSNIFYLSEYLGALARVGAVLHENLKQQQLENMERISVKLISACNTLSSNKLDAAVNSIVACCITAHVARGKVGSKDFINVIVYQGIIKACCQQPFVKQLTRSDYEETASFKVVVDDYLPFWEKLLLVHKNEKIGDTDSLYRKEVIVEPVYEAIIESIVKVINNLDVNFEESNYDANTELTSGLKAHNDADMAILMNLEFLFSKLLPKIENRLHEKYISLLLRNLTSVSTLNPLVPSYYKLLATVLSIAEQLGFFEADNRFEDSDLCQKEINYYIGDLLVNLHHYHKDVQEACLRVITSSSVELIASHLQQLPAAFEVLFHIGRSVLELSSMGVSALDRWMSKLSREELTPFFKQVIPHLYVFLDNRRIKVAFPDEYTEYAQRSSSRGGSHVSKRRKLVEQWRKESSLGETQLSRLQQAILQLLGRLDMQSLLSLLDQDYTDVVGSWSRKPVVTWLMQFQELHVPLQLDIFAPRAMEIALQSSDPANKDASFELLHAIFVIFLENAPDSGETTNDHKQFLRKMLQGMFKLGCKSSDSVGRNIFNNLLHQTCHWFARKDSVNKKFVFIFENSLLEALTCPTDIEVREFAAECLHEYVSWTFKPSDEERSLSKAVKQDIVPHEIDYILSKITSYCDHPCPFKRQGAAMGFNRIYKELREQLTSIVDIFWLELFCAFVKNLLLEHPSREVFAALDHICRVLVERPEGFNVVSEARRRPPEFEGVLLKHAVKWLLAKCNSSNERCREKCMQMVDKLVVQVQGISSLNDFIETEGIDMLRICKMKTTSNITLMSDLLLWMDSLSTSIHMLKWLKENEFDVLSAVKNSENSWFLENLNDYISKISSCSAGSIDWLSGESSPFCPQLSTTDAYDRARRQVTFNLLAFLAALEEDLITITDLLHEDVWQLLSRCLSSPAFIGFTTVSQNQLNSLRSALSQLLPKLQKHLGDNILKENFVRPIITKLASSLPDNEHGQLAANLSDLIRRQSISVELNSLNTLIVLKQINLLDADDQGLIKDETLWNSENLIQAIANCLVGQSDKAIKPNKSQTLYLELLLDFAFLLQNKSNITKLIECMCDETQLKYEDDDQSKNVTKGQHFKNTLFEKIFAHICQFPAESVTELMKRFSENFEFISKCLCKLLDRCRNCEDSVKSSIATLIDKDFPTDVSREQLDSAITLIYSTRNFLPGNNIRMSKLNKIFCFLCKGVRYYEYISSLRPRILKTLLQICLVGNSSTHEESDAYLKETLEKFIYYNRIYISSENWGGNSDFYKEVFNILLEMIRRTGNADLVMLVTKALADDPSHLYRDKFKSILGQSSVFLKNNSAAILDELYKFRNDKILKAHSRVKLVQDFMLPIIESTSFKQAEEFFLKHIKDIVVSLKDETNQNKKINSTNLETLVPPRAASMLLINALFSKFPSSELTSIMCPIVQKSEEIGKDKSGNDTAVLLRTSTVRVRTYLEDELNQAAKDNLKDEYELYLSYKQIAFNTLVILISNTKRDVKSLSFYRLIFKNVKFIMPRELITITNMAFDEIPKRRQAQIGIRRAVRSEKRKRRNSTSSIESYQLFTQSLGNSTFADEIRKYDFPNSVLREDTPTQENEDTDQMIVELEADCLNSHPCMPSLCGTITNLHKITTDANASTSDATPKVDGGTPVWISCISDALKLSSNEQSNEEINAKLLLIKLLYNCNETNANIFTPYAKVLLPPIIKFIIEYKVRCFDNKLNYMIGDILGMLTSWSSVATPETNEIYQLLEFLIEKTPNDRKDVMKLNIEIMKTVISSWKDNISVIPHEKILDLLSDTDLSKIGTSIEIICCLLNNNIKPYAEESLDRFYRKLEQKVLFKDRSIRQKSAEILGMLYRFLSNCDGNSPSLIEERLENLTKQILRHALDKSANPDGLDTMILFTSLMKNHYPSIVTYFIKDIVPLLSEVNGYLQQHVLDIVNTALELDNINENHYSDELYLGINSQLINVFRMGNVDTQEAALKVVTALRDFLDYDNLAGLMLEVVKHFSNHSRLACRNAYYDVLMNVYEYYQTTPCAGSIEVSWSDSEKLSAKDLIKNALVSGLEDANEDLRNKMFQFWNNQGRVRTDLVDRLKDLFELLYSPDLESSFLSLFLQLLLNVCQLNPAYYSCVFPDRNGRSTNQSEILDLKQSRVNSASVAPTLVRTERKSNYNSFGSSMGSVTGKRSTQQSLLFEPTVNPADEPPMPSVGSSSLHSFAVDATVSQNRTSHSKRSYPGNDLDDNDDDGDFKVPVHKARRLLSDKKKIGQSAAFMNQRRNAIMQTERMEQKTRMESAVHLTRNYTKDPMPDRTLTNENLVVFLLNLAKKDMTIASQLLTSLLKGIIHGYQKKCSEPNNQEQSKQILENVIKVIDESFRRIMGQTKQATRGVISVVLDTCLEFSNLPVNLSSSKCIDELYDVSNRSGLHSLGALVLENSLSKNNSNTWVYLARLYRSLGFDEIVQGIFEEKLAGDVREALEAEAAGEWREAIQKYQSTAKELQRGKVDEEADFVYEAYFNCMARMGEWNGLKEALVNVNEVDEMWNDSWSKENLLPWLFKAELNSALMSSETKDISFFEKVKVWLSDSDKSDYIKTNIGEELSMLYLVNKSIDRASEVSQNNRKLFLEDWMQLPALSHNLIMDKCLKLQRLMDIESAIAVLRASKLGTVDWFPNCIDLLEKWDSNPPMKNDSLSHWELRTKYRAHFCGAVMKKLKNPEIASFENRYYMSLLDLALNHENAHLAKKVLRKCNKNEPMVIAGKSRAELLLARMYETRDLNEMLKKIADSWKTIDQVNRLPKLDSQVKLMSQKHVTEICSTLHSVVSTNRNELELFINLFKYKFPKIDESDCDCVLAKLYETGLESLKTAVQIADEIVGVNSKADLAETYLTLVKYCQQENDRSITVESKMIESLLRAMKLGSKEARHLFPIILSLPRLAQSHSRVFFEESKQVPAWMFLSWANQMLARIDTEIGPTLEPVLLRLACEYPSALKYPLNIRSTNFTSPTAKNTFEKLKSYAPFDNLTANFVQAIKYVILPETLLFNCLIDIQKSILCKESDVETKWNELERLTNNLFSDTAPNTGNFKGSLFIAFKDKNQRMANQLRELLVKRPLNVDNDSYPLFRKTLEDSKLLESERKEHLDAFSTWFNSYQSLPHRIEIPGQYSGDNMPVAADKIVKISKFSDRFTVMSSLRKPVKISVVGNDGIEYGYLVKQGEDLRQDERIMQALRLMDSFLALDNVDSPVMKYSLKTYNVIPFTSNLGLLSWVDESTCLKDFILSCLDSQEMKEYVNTEKNYQEWLPSGASKNHQYHNLYCEVSRPKTVENFRKNVNSLPQDILRRGILELSQSAESYHYLRTQFGSSLSAMSVCHWLLGIGDRHLENALLCLGSGQLCGIDFGHAFGSATEVLAIPELLPFRLTPQMLNLFEPFRVTGLIKESMFRCLGILRKRKLLIMASIEVFIHEPLMDWAKQAKYSAILNGVDISDTDYNSRPREKIERARKKLDGANPVKVMTEELESGHKNKPYLEYLKSMLKGEKGNVRSSKPQYGLTVREQVECLIDLATDEHILGKSYVGLRAWV